MSRGFDFDSFDLDDFRESDSYDRGRETGAGRGGGSLSNTSVRLQLQKLREKETISGRRDSQAEISRASSPDHRDLPSRSTLTASLHVGAHMCGDCAPLVGDSRAALGGCALARGEDSNFKALGQRRRRRNKNRCFGRFTSLYIRFWPGIFVRG